MGLNPLTLFIDKPPLWRHHKPLPFADANLQNQAHHIMLFAQLDSTAHTVFAGMNTDWWIAVDARQIDL